MTSVTYIRAQLRMNLLGFVGLVMTGQLIEDSPASTTAVVVIGRRLQAVVGLDVSVAVLDCIVIETDTPFNLQQRPVVAVKVTAEADADVAARKRQTIYT